MKIENYPVVKILFPYVVGILIAYVGDFSYRVCRFQLIAAIVAFALTVMVTFLKAYQWRFLQTAMMNVAFIAAGITLTNSHFHLPRKSGSLGSGSDWLVRVAENPAAKEKSVKIEAEVMRGHDESPVKGKVLLYLQPSDEAGSLEYGDLLLVHANLSRIMPPQNPDVFDNRQYMRRRGIYFSGFVHDGSWVRVGHKPSNRLKSFAQGLRRHLAGLYMLAGMNGEELDVLKAILLGDDDTLDPELRASYSSAGVSHILCVSGMHVGVIFMIINFLLKPLDFFRHSRILKVVLVMLVIWLYAHITGLAPSVTRSAAMFTFVALGQLLRRNTDVFHSLFASVFILLIINPLLLFEVGFQLSYLAVAGIVLFQPKLASIYRCRTRLGKYFWELLTVSVAAQLGTSPVSIYYFAQFPNYFVLSNLSVIALSFAVIITGVVLLPASFIPAMSKGLSWILTMEIRLMNRIIVFVEQMPHSVTENIDYHLLQVFLLYGFVGCLCCLLYRRSRRAFWGAAVMLTLFCVSFSVKKWMLGATTGTLVYHIRKVSVYEFADHGQAVWFSDSMWREEGKLYQYNIRNHVRKCHLHGVVIPIDTASYDTPFLCKRGNLIRFNHKNYLILSSAQRCLPSRVTIRVPVDCLILHRNPRLDPEEVMVAQPFGEVVADGSNTPYYVENWRSFCKKKSIPFSYTGERNLDVGE